MEKNKDKKPIREDKPTQPLPGVKKDRNQDIEERKKKESWSEVDGKEELQKKADDKKVKK